jgi:hypothetical protein
MNQLLKVRTVFDCTRTGVVGRFRAEMLPFQDRAGQAVESESQWNRSRNQQRNFETLQQTIGLRTQLLEVSDPVYVNQHWHFDVAPDRAEVFGRDLADLLDDCANVPMIQDVSMAAARQTPLQPTGADMNIWFELINN